MYQNVLKGNVPLTRAQMTKLRPRRRSVRQEDVAEEEAQNYPKRWLSLRTAYARIVRTRRSAPEVMQPARKVVIQDEFDRK